MNTINRGYDIGYGFTKYIKGIDLDTGYFICDSFPSIAVRSDGTTPSSIVNQERNTKFVMVKDACYEVGHDISYALSLTSARNLDNDYVNSDEYLALNYAALAYMGDTHIDHLVVGLPVMLMESKRDAVVKLLKGHHEINDEFSVTIRNVYVIPQPLGGRSYAEYLNKKEPFQAVKNGLSLTVDPGFFSFDWVVSRGLRTRDALCGHFEGGVNIVLKKIAEALSRDYNTHYTNYLAIDEGITSNNFTLYGNSVPIRQYLTNAIPYVREPVKAMKNLVGSGEDISNILMVGGGVKFYRQMIQAMYPNHTIYSMPDSMYWNVMGFYIIAENFASLAEGAA